MESTFQEVAELWLGNIRCRVKESTYAKYVNVVRKHLVPALGNCRDEELTTRQAEELVRRKLGLELVKKEAAERISEKTMGDILMVLKEILSYGELLGYHTPCRLELLHLKKKEKTAVVLEEQSQMKLEAFLLGEKDPVRTGILLSLYMGIYEGLSGRSISSDRLGNLFYGTEESAKPFSEISGGLPAPAGEFPCTSPYVRHPLHRERCGHQSIE